MLHEFEQGSTVAVALGASLHGDPVQIVRAVGERRRTEAHVAADLTRGGIARRIEDEDRVAAGLTADDGCINQLERHRDFRRREHAGGGEQALHVGPVLPAQRAHAHGWVAVMCGEASGVRRGYRCAPAARARIMTTPCGATVVANDPPNVPRSRCDQRSWTMAESPYSPAR